MTTVTMHSIAAALLLLALSTFAWAVSIIAPPTNRGERLSQVLRHAFGLWTLANGALAIIVSLTHHDLFGPLYRASLVHGSAVVGQHGVIAGALMLYLARHVYQGQRRAALVLLAVFASQIVKYTVFTSSPTLLMLSIVSFTILLYGHKLFDRNLLPLPFVNRLKDIGIILVGVLGALVLSLAASSYFGHRPLLPDVLTDVVQSPLQLAVQKHPRFNVGARYHLKVVLDTLFVAVIALTAWSLFRPARFRFQHSHSDRERAHELLTKYSTSTEDFFKLWPRDKNYYFAPGDGEGFVAYRVVTSIAFALADPIAAPGQQARLLEDFRAFCRGKGWAVCFLAVPASSRKLYGDELKFLKIGSSAVIDVTTFTEQTSRDKWWRWQRNRAKKAGLQYEVNLPPHSDDMIAELEELSRHWLTAGDRKEQGFALGYFDPAYLQQCSLHMLRDAEGQLLAFANELPVFAGSTQRTVDLIRYRPGENGAMPFLLQQLIAQLDSEGSCQTFDLGFVPLAGVESSIVNIARRLATSRFSSLGLEQFKNKFDPIWEANYLAYDGDLIDLARIATSLEAALKRPE